MRRRTLRIGHAGLRALCADQPGLQLRLEFGHAGLNLTRLRLRKTLFLSTSANQAGFELSLKLGQFALRGLGLLVGHALFLPARTDQAGFDLSLQFGDPALDGTSLLLGEALLSSAGAGEAGFDAAGPLLGQARLASLLARQGELIAGGLVLTGSGAVH